MSNFWEEIRGTTETIFGIGKGGPDLEQVGATARLKLANLLRWLPGGSAIVGHLISDSSGDLGVTKDNMTAAVNPTVNDDNTQGYSRGSFWFNIMLNRLFVCLNAATGAALWKAVDQDASVYHRGISIFDATAPYKTANNATPFVAVQFQFPGTSKVGSPTIVQVITQGGNTSVVGAVQLYDSTNANIIAQNTNIDFSARTPNTDYIDNLTPITNLPTGAAVFEVIMWRVAGNAAFRCAELYYERPL